MYVSNERIERNGYLIAYKGEVMTEAEARRRGIYAEPQPEPKPKSKRARKKKTEEAEG